MGKIRKPRSGSRAFRPRKRAGSQNARIVSWPAMNETKLLGFAGFKAGMTHLLMIDDHEGSPTKGHEISVPVTVVETPSLLVLGLRAYSSDVCGLMAFSDAYANIDKKIAERINLKKNRFEDAMKKIESNVDSIKDVRILAITAPDKTGFGRKKPDVIEIAVGGKNAKEKLEFCKGIIGKEVKPADVFSDGEYVDAISITKGKGWQGAVKRFGVHLQRRKATGRRRHVGTLGPWHPARVMYTTPMAGQMGYHKRTEINKRILKIAGKDEVNPKGGFLNYGFVKNDCMLIKGSVGGPCKRMIKFRKSIRENGKPVKPEIKYISKESKQGKSRCLG
ncbi:50S ribosomal protein L3 [Candidatus Micrarchaeota archaeon]|nr:50S ribosomal protein L3 [Candidatus Micrarchaeota archaeon]